MELHMISRVFRTLRLWFNVSWMLSLCLMLSSFCSSTAVYFLIDFLAESFMILMSLSARVWSPLALVESAGLPPYKSSHSFWSLFSCFSIFFCSSFLNFFSSSCSFSEKSGWVARNCSSSLKVSTIYLYIFYWLSLYSSALSSGVWVGPSAACVYCSSDSVCAGCSEFCYWSCFLFCFLC